MVARTPTVIYQTLNIELKTTKSVRQMWQDVAHVHTEIDDSIEEWLEDVSIRTRAHNEDVDEMKSENYKNWGGKKMEELLVLEPKNIQQIR